VSLKPFKAIAAMSDNRVIGRGNALPWHLPEDFKWFKRVTTGHLLLMGRRTYESIGKPLPGRRTVVLTRGRGVGFGEGVEVVGSLDAAVTLAGDGGGRDMFVCGGAEVYAQTLRLCSELYLTRVRRVVEGDAWFPVFEPWFAPREIILETPDFVVERWVSREP